MSIWLNQHLHALQLALRRLLRHPLATLLSTLVIGLAASLPAAGFLALTDLDALAGRANPEPQLTVFMTPQASAADAQAIQAKLGAHPGVVSAQFVSKEAALDQMKSSAIGDVIQSLEANPLPDAFIVRGKDASASALEQLRGEVAAWPRVESVQLDSDWAKKLQALVGFGKRAVLLLAIALAAALVAVVANTIRLQILNQREEIELSQLIGATDSFIRRPFLYFGALEALLAGALALGLVAIGFHQLNASLGELARLYASDFRLALPSWRLTALFLAGIAVLGWIGAMLSVNLYLRQLRHAKG